MFRRILWLRCNDHRNPDWVWTHPHLLGIALLAKQEMEAAGQVRLIQPLCGLRPTGGASQITSRASPQRGVFLGSIKWTALIAPDSV